MAKLVFNRDGGKTDEIGHLLGLSRVLAGEVLDGLQVVANGVPNMSVAVGYGTGAIPAGSAGTAYKYFMGVDSNENVTIPTANGSNPRNDLIVAYIDKGVTPSTSFTNNSNGVLKIVVVSGAPAVTPADPSGATIQAAVGAGNPYIILARVLTGAGVTQINNGNITDLRSMAAARILDNSIATSHLQNLIVTTSKVANGAITYAKTDGKIWWEELARVSAGSVLSDLASGAIPAKRYLRLVFSGFASGGTYYFGIQFNNDTGANYADIVFYPSGGSVVNDKGTSRAGSIRIGTTVPTNGSFIYTADILNLQSSNKMVKGETTADFTSTAANTAPDFETFSGKWVNTSSLITSIKIVKLGGTSGMGVGSELVVLGHD